MGAGGQSLQRQIPDLEMRDEEVPGSLSEHPNNHGQDYEETQTNPNGFFAETKTAAACSVRVALRVRPLVGRELYESPNICVTCYPESDQLVIGKDRNFTFDKVFEINTRQQDIFDGCVKNLVLGCFSGYNATVLAYGQTGSGKTFTMGSGYTIGLKDEELGIIPRVIRLIFDEVEKRKHKAEFIIKCTFLEIYNEELNDLLDHGTLTAGNNAAVIDRFIQKKDITIREEKNGNISVFGLREEKVNCYEELAACLDKGSNFRSTASTLMNNCSSRSHAIFTITIEQHIIDDLYQPNQPAQPTADTEEFMVAKFHFVDLAGSERAKRTGATGATLKEGISINKGLLALGNVISALTEDAKKNAHVPYRDSKLTRILQDSLGGNSRTSMIACVSPAEINFEETLNTLKYASRARNIKNKPIVNRDPNSAQIAQLRQQVYELQRELVGARKLLVSNNIEFESSALVPADLPMLEGQGYQSQQKDYGVSQAEIQRYESEIKDLRNSLQNKDKKINQLSSQFEHVSDQLSQNQIEFFQVQKERDVSRFQLEQIVQILKKREIYDDIMKEFHGFTQSETDMNVDELNGKQANPGYDFLFGSSGPCILEEYQVKVEEQKKELGDKHHQIKTLQKDYEMLMQQSNQDTKNLEAKEKEIERLKRSVNKLQKENVQIRNEQRRGTNTTRANPAQQPSIQPAAVTARKVPTSMNTERKPLNNHFSQLKQKEENKEWISSELNYNIKHFNELFIENLSQSLSTMLVLKKPGQQDEQMKTPQTAKNDDINPLNEVQEFNPNQNEFDSEDDSEEENAVEIEQIIPQGEKEVQEVIDQNEETKKQDDEMKQQLSHQEQQIVTLDDNLKNKEALLQAIKDSHKMMQNNLLEAMKNEYHKKVESLQQEMQYLEKEKVENMKKADSAVQKSKLEEAYKKKLKDLEDKLNSAKMKDREQTLMMKESKTQKDRISRLESEIEKIKTQKVTMMKKMKEESDKHRKWKAERVKELMQVKQANLKKDREIMQLKRENKRKDILAKRKQEELSVLMKKTKLDKQKQINASKDRMKKASIDISAIQKWIITNTEKMLRYKDLQQLIDQELMQKKHSEDQIAEEQNSLASLQVRREKLEFKKCQLEQNNESPDTDAMIYELEEEISAITYEMKAIQENIETIEEKSDFIETKISQINSELIQFSPDDVEQLRFDQVQSIEGARACLGAFFGILLDINVYKKQLENQAVQYEATIESLGQQLEELRKIQQANEISFQKQLEQISREYQEKEDLMVKLIMENGGSDMEQLVANIQGKEFFRDYMLNRANSMKESEDQQVVQAQLQRRNTVASNVKQQEIQKSKEQAYTQSKTTLSKRVAELERKLKEESKKAEAYKHQHEQSAQEKEVIKKQLQTVTSKLKTKEIQEVKQSKVIPSLDVDPQYNSIQPQKSPRHQGQIPQQKIPLTTLNDRRNQKKMGKKLGGNSVQQQNQLNEPRVIADEPMDDNEDDIPQIKDQKITKANSTNEAAQVLQAQRANNLNLQLKDCDLEQTNVFTRLSQLGNKGRTAGNNGSLNTSQTMNQVQTPTENIQLSKALSYEDDTKWKCLFSKEMAHNGNICAITSIGNQLYSSSNRSLRIWDVESMQLVSDINAHSSFIKCMTIWQEKNILLTASEKIIFLWDMISLTQVGQLKAHKDEIRAMTVSPDGSLMFSAGKGSQNAPGLLLWDLRKGSNPIDEREKNQDIFSLSATHDSLYYGCRSHQIIHFNYRSSNQEPECFVPPHFDAVTSLSILDGTLVSGSRDKSLRSWDISQSSKVNHIQMEVAHNDWINTLETDKERKELYSGSKDGVVKVWKMQNQKLQCMASMTASNSGASVNAISSLDKQFGTLFATGSSDKYLKIWKRQQNQGSESGRPDVVMEDPFQKANIDRNQDFFDEDQEQRFFHQGSNKFEEVKQIRQEHKQVARSNTTGMASANYYVPTQTSKLEQKRRQKRLQDNQAKYQKENDQNYQL